MPIPTLSLFLFIFFISPALSVFLTQPTYPTLLSHLPKSSILLIFTVRWCDHSRALHPEIAHLANLVRNSSVLIASLDADADPVIPAALAVSSYPTILFLPRGAFLKPTAAFEFADYRWAEVIVEFLNNHTQEEEHLTFEPRDKFLKWRETVPFNLGMSGKKDSVAEIVKDNTPVPGIREPEKMQVEGFVEKVLGERHVRYMVLFFDNSDVAARELLIQWKQASSAFTHADGVVIGILDVNLEGVEALMERFDIEDVPTCLYFGKCTEEEGAVGCDKPASCEDDVVWETANILDFISQRVMEEMGFREVERKEGKRFHLTEEEYQRMKEDGMVFANDVDMEGVMKGIYKEREEMGKKEEKGGSEGSMEGVIGTAGREAEVEEERQVVQETTEGEDEHIEMKKPASMDAALESDATIEKEEL